MQLTKLTHACLMLEDQGQRLIVDPGVWANIDNFTDVVGVVITHVHEDHFSLEHTTQILQANPMVKIFTTNEVAGKLQSPLAVIVHDDEEATCGLFKLRFFGDKHALVHDNQPQTENVGVMVNDNLYYPGDSFTVPDARVTTLALPVSGPWLKTGESIDFLATVQPAICFPTHDAMLSNEGNLSVDGWIGTWCEQHNSRFKRLNPADTMNI